LAADTRGYVIADIGLADSGREHIAIADTAMPGLIALPAEYAAAQPLHGARTTGALHLTVKAAILIATPEALGAAVRWATGHISRTQDVAAAAMAAGGTSVFAVKVGSHAEYWDYVGRIFDWGDETANVVLDDGGDATMFALWGAKIEAGATLPAPENEEEVEFQRALKAFVAANPGYLTRTVKALKGVSEETTTGVHRLYEIAKKGELPFPA